MQWHRQNLYPQVKPKSSLLLKKLDIQFVVDDILFPIPLKCNGYISEFTVQGVGPIPIAKKSKYKNIPPAANHFPISWLTDPLWWFLKNIPTPIQPIKKPIKGRVLSIIHLRPSLSIKKSNYASKCIYSC